MNDVFRGNSTSFKKGHIVSEETRKKLSKNHKGGGFGWHHSEESRKKIRIATKGKHKIGSGIYKRTEEHRKNISKATKGIPHLNQRGEKNGMWKGGISYEPYSIDWTKTLKRSIRERDKYICQICGKEPSVYVHHIDYNKKNCNPENLIILCHSCHTKTNTHRDYWINFFKGQLLEEFLANN